ncbi:hypothetical protein [Novosphingobium sp.]|uniref:hypothetical protein n=1 Tax=Novosphingobium sp. TaxID=1874826 RepID=UPI003BA93D89
MVDLGCVERQIPGCKQGSRTPRPEKACEKAAGNRWRWHGDILCIVTAVFATWSDFSDAAAFNFRPTAKVGPPTRESALANRRPRNAPSAFRSLDFSFVTGLGPAAGPERSHPDTPWMSATTLKLSLAGAFMNDTFAPKNALPSLGKAHISRSLMICR